MTPPPLRGKARRAATAQFLLSRCMAATAMAARACPCGPAFRFRADCSRHTRCASSRVGTVRCATSPHEACRPCTYNHFICWNPTGAGGAGTCMQHSCIGQGQGTMPCSGLPAGGAQVPAVLNLGPLGILGYTYIFCNACSFQFHRFDSGPRMDPCFVLRCVDTCVCVCGCCTAAI